MTSFHAFSLWLHILSVALWVGSLVFFLIVFGPAVHSLPPRAGIRSLDQGRRRLETLSWVAISILLITGIVSFLLRGLITGFHLGIGYYSVLSIKLLLFLAMAFHHCLQAFKYGPKIMSLTVEAREEPETWPEPLLSCWKKWFVLSKINATLGAILLLLGLALTRI